MKKLVAALAAVALGGLAASGAVSAQDKQLVLLSTSPGSPHNVFHTRLATIVGKYTDYEVQVSLGQTPVKITVDLARGTAALGFTAPTIVENLKTQTAMYKDLAQAKEFYSNLRGVLSHDGGLYTFVVFADSGIETLDDVKGKTLQLANPGSAAQRLMTAIIEAETGYKPGVDYKLSPLQTAAGVQAFQDGQVDLWASPAVQPNPVVEQFALTREIRLLSISDEAIENIGKLLEAPGRYTGTITPDMYGSNQVNTEPVQTIGLYTTLASSEHADDDAIYAVTKAVWEHKDEIDEAGAYMKNMVTRDQAFFELNMPLQAGALRYYREAGFDIPEELVPPEAKQ